MVEKVIFFELYKRVLIIYLVVLYSYLTSLNLQSIHFQIFKIFQVCIKGYF